MRGRLPIRIVAAGSLLLLAGCQTPPEEDPAYVKATAVESRVAVVERQAASLQELQRQIDQQAAEIRSLRGELEQAQQAAERVQAEQRNLYADVDRRLGQLEAHAAAPPPVLAPTATPGVSPPTVALTDEQAYQGALAQLRARNYAAARATLETFGTTYPASGLRDNALYWLGEVHYVERRFPEALATFQRVIREFAQSRKLPDALLKSGFAQLELKQVAEGRRSLQRVVAEFPESPAAKEASARLAKLDAAGTR